jgi:hypothetical protein
MDDTDNFNGELSYMRVLRSRYVLLPAVAAVLGCSDPSNENPPASDWRWWVRPT